MTTPPRTRYAILGALSLGPLTGAEIRRLVVGTLSHFWHEGYGQIYPTLRVLESDGLITTESRQGGRGPERKVCSLTDEGRNALRSWLGEPVVPPPPPRDELLLKLFFGRHAPAALLVHAVEERRGGLLRQLETFEEAAREMENDPSPDARYWALTLTHGLAVTRASLDWCDATSMSLRQESPCVR